MVEESVGFISSQESPPLESRVLNLASGESGIVSANEADAIIAASLDECALIFIRGQLPEKKIIAAGVHYQSPERNSGEITDFYQWLQKQGEVKPEISVVWGRTIHPDNKKRVLEEIKRIGIGSPREVSGGEVLLEIPPEIRKQIRDYYRTQLVGAS